SVASGAKAALDGYEYQLSVSVLAALRLMLITKSASRITLEPATPGRVQPSANVADGYKLVVQVKLRNSGPWSIADFDALLKRGKTRRPAKHHLDDPGTRYLLNSDFPEEIWSGRRDSNPRPQPWQGCALPLSYARAPAEWRRGSYAGKQDLQPLPSWRPS